MKKLWIILIVMLAAGCAGMGGMQGSGSSGGMGTSGSGTDDIYSPNYSPMFKNMDPSFQPYYGG